jgi:hypothetical protein
MQRSHRDVTVLLLFSENSGPHSTPILAPRLAEDQEPESAIGEPELAAVGALENGGQSGI